MAEKATETPAVAYIPVQFRSVHKAMVYGMPGGNHICFSDGLFTAKTEAEYNFLKNHLDFDRSLFVVK
jgi:hypothetical protein